MDSLCLKAGIHGMPPTNAASGVVGGCLDIRTSHVAQVRATAVSRPSSSSASGTSMSVENPPPPSQKKNSAWGFSFRYPLRSLWPSGKTNRFDAMAADDAVLLEEKDEEKSEEEEEESEGQNGNWVLKILHVQSLWKEEKKETENENGLGVKSEAEEEEEEEVVVGNDHEGSCDGECEGCRVGDDDDDEKIKFDRESFSKLLKKVSLAEARLYAQMSYLGNIAYAIPQIKPKNLLRHHGLRFVTSSLEKKEQALKAEKEQALKAEKEKALAEGQQPQQEKASMEAQDIEADNREKATDKDEKKISSSAAYEIAASAASYLHSYSKNILPFRSSKSTVDEDLPERTSGSSDNTNVTHEDMASFMATTDSVTSVVAAKEEVKQAVADNLNSTRSSPCEWFICDDDQSATRYFIIQGSESLASWQANLLFEPIKFEGLDVPVHRGIYEAAKGIYEQMLPEVREHLKVHGSRASFRFTGHSLGGSLSLLVNLMLLIRGEVQPSSLLPVITFGAPAIMCGGDHLLRQLRLPRSHVQSIAMHRDIVPRAFSCSYPTHVAEFLKAVNGNFRHHPCLNNQKLLYAPMGEFLILQPDEKFSPHHELLPSGSGLYLLRYPAPDGNEAEKQIRAAQTVFLNSPHPLEILSDRSAYGTSGSIQRDHDMNSYLKSIRHVIRQDLNNIRKARRQQRHKIWLPLVAPRGVNAGIVVRTPVASGNAGQGQFNFSGIIQNGRESFRRFHRLVASQQMHLLVVLLFPARLLILGTYSIINFP